MTLLFQSIWRRPATLSAMPLAEAPASPLPDPFAGEARRPASTEERPRAALEPVPKDGTASFEKKYVLAPIHQQMITAYLQRVLIPDPNYPDERISSIYYDTPRFDFYHAKRASEFLKTKVRLRWYGNVSPAATAVKGFLEVKEKVGAQRQKDRIPLEVPAHVLRSRRLADPYLTTILEQLRPHGHEVPMPLFPLLVVQYQRRRFVDPASGTRVAIDTDITVPAINCQFMAAVAPARVYSCVLEVKGPSRSHPAWLHPIRNQVRPDAFSKYGACFESVFQPTGIRE